jgi:hypothetical protein
LSDDRGEVAHAEGCPYGALHTTAVESQAGAIGDEELREIVAEACAFNAAPVWPLGHPKLDGYSTGVRCYAEGVITERKRDRATIVRLISELAELRLAQTALVKELRKIADRYDSRRDEDGRWYQKRALHALAAHEATAAAPAASPAGGGAAGLVDAVRWAVANGWSHCWPTGTCKRGARPNEEPCGRCRIEAALAAYDATDTAKPATDSTCAAPSNDSPSDEGGGK